MKYFEIKGEQKRFVFSVRAISEYLDSLAVTKDADGNDIESDNSMEEVIKWAYSGLKFGAKAEGEKFTFKKDDIKTILDEDFELFCSIASYCRKQFQIFQTAVAGNYQENGDAKKKVIA